MIRVSAGAAMIWFGLAVAAETPKPASPPEPDAELLEFLGSFETDTGQWPELSDILATRTRPRNPPPAPREEVQR